MGKGKKETGKNGKRQVGDLLGSSKEEAYVSTPSPPDTSVAGEAMGMTLAKYLKRSSGKSRQSGKSRKGRRKSSGGPGTFCITPLDISTPSSESFQHLQGYREAAADVDIKTAQQQAATLSANVEESFDDKTRSMIIGTEDILQDALDSQTRIRTVLQSKRDELKAPSKKHKASCPKAGYPSNFFPQKSRLKNSLKHSRDSGAC